MSAGFEYYLKYTTDHRILTRERLRGFDSVYLGTGADMPFTLANRYEDRRPDISPGHRYLAIVFDHTDGAQYRLAYTKDGVAEALWTEFSARTAQVTTPASGTVADPVLLIRSGTRWVRYAGDWALYDGYVTESGRTTVELRVRTAPERIAPASPKFFDRIYFYGAEEGMSLTLHKECSLRPRFSSAPGYGSAITFADGAGNRFIAGAGSPFGEWSVRTDSYAAREGDQVLRNPLFRPTLSEAGHYANAPSAQIMQVGDRDDVQEDGTNFTPRIVRFAGLHPLPAGERWGYPSGLAEYPLAAFHFTGDAATEGFTLCFEDRDGIRGLHHRYDRQAAQEATCEEIRATLHAIESYDPQAASARCTFTRLSEG